MLRILAALAMASELAASAVVIVTTEEVLTEYLTFFADTVPLARERAARNVERLHESPTFGSFRRVMNPFKPV